MAHAEGTIAIARPIQEVFDFILDGANNRLWRPGVTDIRKTSDGSLGVGTTFKQGLKGPGGRIDGDYEIVECEPNKWIKFQVVAGPARPTGSYRFDSQGASTQVTFVLDLQSKGLAKLMDPMISKTMQSEVGTLQNLKVYLETPQ